MSHIGRFGQISRSIAVAHEKARPKNTKTAYRPKITEFLQFCDSLYGKEVHPTYVTEEKHTVLCRITRTVKNIQAKNANQQPTLVCNGSIALITIILFY